MTIMPKIEFERLERLRLNIRRQRCMRDWEQGKRKPEQGNFEWRMSRMTLAEIRRSEGYVDQKRLAVATDEDIIRQAKEDGTNEETILSALSLFSRNNLDATTNNLFSYWLYRD